MMVTTRDPKFYHEKVDPGEYHDSPSTLEKWEWGHRNRLATVFWYLTNVTRGGETSFPRADGRPTPEDVFDCKDSPLKVTF